MVITKEPWKNFWNYKNNFNIMYKIRKKCIKFKNPLYKIK